MMSLTTYIHLFTIRSIVPRPADERREYRHQDMTSPSRQKNLRIGIYLVCEFVYQFGPIIVIIHQNYFCIHRAIFSCYL
jgi:hypothetical protein